MRVLLTGATGFLGAHILKQLDEHEVIAVSRREVDDPRFIVANLADADSLTGHLAGIDCVIHAAGFVSHRPDDAEQMRVAHLDATENLLKAAKAAGVKRIVYVSTSGVIALSEEQDAVADERSPTPMRLISDLPYYRSKLFAEEIALSFNSETFDVICLNPSLLLGPGDVNGSSTATVRLFLDDQVPLSPPGGVSFADVRDVAKAAVRCLSHGRPGERYLLGAVNMSFKRLYQTLSRLTDRPPPISTSPRWTKTLLDWFPTVGTHGFVKGYEMDRFDLVLSSYTWYLDDSKAREELNWNPRDPIETLNDTIEDLTIRMVHS